MPRRRLANIEPDRPTRRRRHRLYVTDRAGIALFTVLAGLAGALIACGELTTGFATFGAAFSWLTILVGRRQGR